MKKLRNLLILSTRLKYEKGTINLSNGIAELDVPQGFKYLNAEQSRFVITELWGNPPQTQVLGMLFPEDGGPFADSSFAFIIKFDEMGYVKDEDAEKIDYDDLLKQMQKEEISENKERLELGYTSVHMLGWAQKPFYDKSNKILHWAKELKFGEEEFNTLNYDVRILGRKGILSMNAVATIDQLSVVKKDIDKVLHSAKFSEGNKYADFNPKVDEVAAWTIGGLVAGKILAKVGFFAILLKFWKLIALGVLVVGGGILKFFKKKKSEELVYDIAVAPKEESNS